MVDNISIRNKFTEFSAKYANRNIDDFDNFVCARIADYFINHEGASTDTIYAVVEDALHEPTDKESADSDEEVDENSRQHVLTSSKPSASLPKKLLRVAPYIAGAGATLIGFIALAVRHKKKK
jgi:hypothetical protein